MSVRGAGVKTAPALSFPQTPFFCGPSGVLCRCSGHTDLARGLLRLKWYKRFIQITAAPCCARCLRCSGFASFAPWGAPAAEYRSGLFRSNPARSVLCTFAGPRLRRLFFDLSVSERLVHCLIRCAVSKQRERPQTGNRPGGIFIASLASAGGAECFGLCLTHYW